MSAQGAQAILYQGVEQTTPGLQCGAPALALVATDPNYGGIGIEFDPSPMSERNDIMFRTNAITGEHGMPPAFPIRVEFPTTFQKSARAAELINYYRSMGFKATKANPTSGVYTYTMTPNVESAYAVTLWHLLFMGDPTIGPELFSGFRAQGINYTTNLNQEVQVAITGQHLRSTLYGPGVKGGSNTGTETGRPILLGPKIPIAVDSDTGEPDFGDPIIMKIKTALATGYVELQFCRAATIGAADFTGAPTIKVYADAANGNKQTRYRGNDDFLVEAATVDGNLGADAKNNREPLSIFLPGDLALYAANDLFSFALDISIPGNEGSAPTYTGTARSYYTTGLFTPAHIRIYRGGTESGKAIADFQSNTFGITRPQLVPYRAAGGPSAKRPKDWRYAGYFNINFQSVRELENRLIALAMQNNQTFYVEETFEGELIGATTYRESIVHKIKAAQFMQVNSPIAGTQTVNETAQMQAAQPDDGSDPIEIVITTSANLTV